MKIELPEPATQVKQCQLGGTCNCDFAHECNMLDVFTESQLRAAMVAAWNEAIEACVNAYSPDDTADDYTDKMMAMKEQA